MFDLDKWQEIFATIKKNKLRSILTALGIFWGIFMLVFMLGAGKGLENGAKQGFSGMASNSFYLWTRKTTIPFKGMQPGRRIRFTNNDTKAIKENIPEIKYACPRLQLEGDFLVSNGLKNGAFNVYGDMPEFQYLQPMNINGRFINQKDIAEKRKVCSIGPRVVELLFEPGEDPIGKYIKIMGVYFKVVGTFQTKKLNGNAERDLQSIYIPFSTMQQTYNIGNRVYWYGFVVQDDTPASVAEEKVKTFLAERHSVSPQDKEAFGSWNAQEEVNKFNNLFTGINVVIWVVGIMTLIAGVVGVSNIMIIIVKERTREIGVRKALGAPPGSIISLVIQEAVFITAFSGYFGLVAGVGVIEGIRWVLEKNQIENDFFKNPEINFQVAIVSTLVLIVAGAIAGLIPAKKAAKIAPIEALRSE